MSFLVVADVLNRPLFCHLFTTGPRCGVGVVAKRAAAHCGLSTREQIGVVPLAMPLMAGPGAISSTIVYGARYPSMFDTVGISITIGLFCLCSWLLFRSAPLIVRFLGQTGINVITRIMGLILGALGIEFIANGLRNLFPGLA